MKLLQEELVHFLHATGDFLLLAHQSVRQSVVCFPSSLNTYFENQHKRTKLIANKLYNLAQITQIN